MSPRLPYLLRLLAIGLLLPMAGCMRWDYGEIAEFDVKEDGLFIVGEGNFQYGNATLSFYIPDTGEVLNDIFSTANGMKLGDVAQSMTLHDDKGWIVVNNSHVIFAIDPDTFRETGRIENLTSPRYIHFVSDSKAYITQIWDNRIFIVNPSKYEITGYIEVPGMAMESGSTEQMVQIGKYVYCTCWSYQNTVIRINTETDEVTARLAVGIQPKWITADKYGRLWTLTDGGYEDSPYGHEPPALVCIDPESFSVTNRFIFKQGDSPRDLQLNGDGDTLYWINEDVWCMDVSAQRLPVSPLVESRNTRFYGLTVSPTTGDIYVADAIDYMQPGVIYRFSPEGEPIDEFNVGVTPGAFCWKTNHAK